MATRISLTVSTAVDQRTNVSRFALDASSIVGLVEYTNGLVQVNFIARNGKLMTTIVDNDYDSLMDAIEQVDAEQATKLTLAADFAELQLAG